VTRKSRRELERALDDLTDDHGGDDRPPVIVYEDPETGAWYDSSPLRGEAEHVDREHPGTMPVFDPVDE